MAGGGISTLQSIGLIASFVIWAALCTVANKAILNNVLNDSNFLFLTQAVCSAIMIYAAVCCGVLRREAVSFSTKASTKEITIAVAYTANVAFGLLSIKHVSIPMFGALKRLTILACWVGEYWLFRSNSTMACVPALVVMVGGTLVAGWHDMEFSFVGYVFGFLSAAGQGVAFVLSKTLGVESRSESLEKVFSVVFLNAIVSAVLMVFVISFSGWSDIWKGEITPHGVFQVGFNSLLILLLNVIIFLDCTLNTPLSHAVAGNLKAAVTSLAGIIIFGTEINVLGGTGLLLNLVGGAWYSAVRFSRSNTTKVEDDVEAPLTETKLDTFANSPTFVVERHHGKEPTATE